MLRGERPQKSETCKRLEWIASSLENPVVKRNLSAHVDLYIPVEMNRPHDTGRDD